MPLAFRTDQGTNVIVEYNNIATVEAYTTPPPYPGRYWHIPSRPEVTLTTRDNRVYTVHHDDAYYVCSMISDYYAHTIPEKKPIFEL